MLPEWEASREAADVEKWIVEARRGNREALGRLLDICRHFLLLSASKELAPVLRAKVAPSDIVQVTLMEACRNFQRFQGGREEELLAWLRVILRNNVADVRRHFETEKRELSREVAMEGSEANALLHNAPSPLETPSTKAQGREQDQQLERAIRQLPEHYRHVLLLQMSEDLTFVQMAEKLGSTADAVRKLWGRAVEELAKQLESPHEST